MCNSQVKLNDLHWPMTWPMALSEGHCEWFRFRYFSIP